MNLESIDKQNLSVVDVRTPGEYLSDHVPGSVNIPLQELKVHLDELKAMKQPIVLCCASGNRSGQATALLQSHGIDCINGGPWYEVNDHVTESQNDQHI